MINSINKYLLNIGLSSKDLGILKLFFFLNKGNSSNSIDFFRNNLTIFSQVSSSIRIEKLG